MLRAMAARLPSLPPIPSLDPTLARHERAALCTAALAAGPEAPTLCGDWDVKDLVCHLLVRENSPIGAPGIAISALSGLTDREMRRLRRQPFPKLVEKVRKRRLTPSAIGPVDAAFNTVEFFVHHEDIRRAQPRWRRRPMSQEARDALWKAVQAPAQRIVREARVPVVIRRTDTGETATLRAGRDPVEVAGPVSEVVLFLYGRAQLRDLELSGPEEKVARLRGADLGI